jgi:hypothetical protein
MDQPKREEIAKILADRKATRPCERCGNADFSVIDAYANVFVSKEYKQVNIGGRNIPCAVLVCQKCGHVILHALGTLGLLEKEPSKKVDATISAPAPEKRAQ